MNKRMAYNATYRVEHGRPWDGEVGYNPGMTVTHKDKIWMAGSTGIHNASFEPGGFQPAGYWIEIGPCA